MIYQKRIRESFASIIRVVQIGIDEKILKDVNLDTCGAFMIHPILVLGIPDHCKIFETTEENIDIAFKMASDAVRLKRDRKKTKYGAELQIYMKIFAKDKRMY